MEKVLLEWINQKRIFGIAISGPIIKEKALEFNRQQIYEHRLLVSSSTADEIHKKYSALGKMYYNNKYIFCVDTWKGNFMFFWYHMHTPAVDTRL